MKRSRSLVRLSLGVLVLVSCSGGETPGVDPGASGSATAGGANGGAGSGAGGSPLAGAGGGAVAGSSSGASSGAGSGQAGAQPLGGSAGSGGGDAGGSNDAGAPPTFVEDEGADCPVPGLPDAAALPTVAKLPDPFQKLDGAPLASKAEWRCRRQELKRQAEKYIYGEKPPKPESVTGTVSDTSITVKVTHQGKSTEITATVSLPSQGSKPYPAIIGLKSGFFAFPIDESLVKGEGVAIIEYDPYIVGAEQNASRGNKRGAFYDIYGSDSSTGLLLAWSWGVSRIIDVIAESGGSVLKADALGVSGCSRFGKGAFTIGAFDQRIALTLPIESGSGGVPIWRGISGEGAQTANSAYTETYWLGDAFGSFTGKVTSLPLDTHAIVGLVAPRGLFIMDNPHIANLGPRSAHVAALGGAEIYRALGAAENVSYVSAVANGDHCGWRPEWVEPFKNAVGKFLTKTGGGAGTIAASSKATSNLGDWRDWQTPTLD